MEDSRMSAIAILYILKEYSDEAHPLSSNACIPLLEQVYDIKINRGTLSAYIKQLRNFGIDIQTTNRGYYLIDRDLEKSEVHVLCNLIHSSHFICDSSSFQLIDKLLKTQSRYHRKDFKNAVYIQNSRKTKNRQLFLNVDILSEAIQENKMIQMYYLTYNLKKELIRKREKPYFLHPYYIVEENGNLYLICKTDKHDDFTHYRIDRMQDIRKLDTSADALRNSFDPYAYSKTKMYLYSGEPVAVFLRCHKMILNDVIDQFGQEIILQETKGSDYFIARIYSTETGIMYYAMQYALYCEILEPSELRERVRNNLRKALSVYEKDKA